MVLSVGAACTRINRKGAPPAAVVEFRAGHWPSAGRSGVKNISSEGEIATITFDDLHDGIGLVGVYRQRARKVTAEVDYDDPDAGFHGRFRPFWARP